MDRPDSHRVFAAAVHMLSHSACPECGCTHQERGWKARCTWCAERALALDLYQQWKTLGQRKIVGVVALMDAYRKEKPRIRREASDVACLAARLD